jgi:uncharacterized SAM-binding protein YcdF (DUF218 family)
MKAGALFALSLLTGATAALFLVAYIVGNPRCTTPGKADAIVVLGARVGPGSIPSLPLRFRAERAAELYNAGLAPFVIPTGGIGPFPPTEAEAAANVMSARGVPRDAIVLEPKATSTQESADYVAAIAGQRGWKNIILVSDPYHLLRASWLFSEYGFNVQTACTDPSYLARGTYWYQTFREVGGLLYYATTRGWLNVETQGDVSILRLGSGRKPVI